MATHPPALLVPGHDELPALPQDSKGVLMRLLWAGSQGLLIFLAIQVYKIARRQFILEDNTGAYKHAIDVLNWEESLGLMFELDWQRWALAQPDWFIKSFNHLYAWYQWWVICGLMLLAFFAPVRFRFIRRAFLTCMVLVTPAYLIYPLAPPRFMEPHGWPFIDTLAVYGPNYFSETGIVQGNRYAAMPSMHVGWTTFTALAVSLLIRNRWLARAFVVFMASLISYIVIITGNHYWIDGVVGWMFIATGLVINKLIPYPLLERLRKD